MEKPNYYLAPWAVNTVLVLVAPALFAASVYMCFGRVVRMTDGEKYVWIRRTWLTKIFVIGDIISFLTQAIGTFLPNQGHTLQFTSLYPPPRPPPNLPQKTCANGESSHRRLNDDPANRKGLQER